MLETWRSALDNVTASQWANYVEHTDKVIKAAWERDKHLCINVQPLIINLDDNEDDDILEDIESD